MMSHVGKIAKVAGKRSPTPPTPPHPTPRLKVQHSDQSSAQAVDPPGTTFLTSAFVLDMLAKKNMVTPPNMNSRVLRFVYVSFSAGMHAAPAHHGSLS